MRIVVAGASGQLARSLDECVQHFPNIEMILLGRPRLDLEIAGSASAAIRDTAPDVVINAAAFTGVDQAEDEPERALQINAEAAGEIAAAAAGVGAAVVQISTDYVFDGRKLGPYDENDPENPLGIYGRSKFAGEEQVRAANPRHAIVRTAWLYSPFGRNFLKSIIAYASTSDRLTVVDDQQGSPTCALDLAEGLLSMLNSGGGWGETYHLAGCGAATWYEFAQEIMIDCAALGIRHVPVLPIRTEDWPTRAERPHNSVLNSGKFERSFGFVMPDWRLSTRRVIERLARSQNR